MAEIARSRADEYPLPLPITIAAELGPLPDEGRLYRPPTSRGEQGERGDTRESTELARLRRNYTRASSHPPTSSIVVAKPTTFFNCFLYGVRQFWKHQISVTVPHHTCRDHLGTYQGRPLYIFMLPIPLHNLSTFPPASFLLPNWDYGVNCPSRSLDAQCHLLQPRFTKTNCPQSRIDCLLLDPGND